MAPAILARLFVVWALFMEACTTTAHQIKHAWRIAMRAGTLGQYVRDVRGELNIGKFLAIAVIVIGAVVGIKVLGALLPSYFSGLQSTVGTLSTATTGNTDANSLMPTFGLLAAFAGVFAIVGLVIFVVRVRKS